MPPPKHIAFILDGNGRWAQRQGKSIAEGHRKGMENLERILDHCLKCQISIVTIYAFSTENWKRPLKERRLLFELLLFYFQKKIKKLIANEVRIKIIGQREKFPPHIVKTLNQAEEISAVNTKFLLQVALSYGGRAEIVRAAKRFCRELQQGKRSLEELDEALFAHYLDSPSSPDLLIRTGGEERLSNFLLYQAAYSELYFTKTLWPEFSCQELALAVENFSKRNRRFGGREAAPREKIS